MKKYIFIFYAIVALVICYSCNEELDLQPDGRITLTEVFTDYNQVRGYLSACYGYRPSPGVDRSALSDEAQSAEDITAGSIPAKWYAGSYTSSDFACVDGSPWGDYFQGIRKCNVFLSNIDNCTAETTGDELLGWKAQAYTLRALYYLQLIKRYGGVPIITEPFGVEHDFASDTRASFSQVVTQILADCDSALAMPQTSTGFHWEIFENQYEIMTPAVAYAIKSEAVTYAASPLWSDGTYDWADATEINKEALSTCLANDYELFNNQPLNNAAQNPYTLYFLTSSNDMRSRDKETIYQCGGQLAMWKNAGLASTPGVVSSGPCPTQELVDSYEMANGEAPILGYDDDQHLSPIINEASGYDPLDPYANRDPRFYGSIYCNGSLKSLSTDTTTTTYEYPLNWNWGTMAGGLYTTADDVIGYETFHIQSTDAYYGMQLQTGGLADGPVKSIHLEFTCKTDADFDPQFFFVGPLGISEAYSIRPGTVYATDEWTKYSIDVTDVVIAWSWGANGNWIRFDFGENSGPNISILRHPKIVLTLGNSGDLVETYIGGNDEISETSNVNTRTGYYTRKYNSYLSTLNSNNDGGVRLFRLAELYLNFAESAYHSDGPDATIDMGNDYSMSARDAVNAIRARAGMPDFPAGMSSEDFEKKYRNERRVEMAFEEQRFFDVRRWKILDETDKNVTGMSITKNGDAYTYSRFVIDRNCYSDKYLMYPLSQSEVNKIVGNTGVNWQNPGW